MNKALVAGIVILLLWMAAVGHMIYTYVHVKNDILAVKDRAQTAGDASLMKEYLIKLKENLERIGYTHGYYAIIFKNAYTDAGEDYRVICNLIDRLGQIEKLPKNSTAYQTALDDVRGILRELEINPFKWYYYNRFPTIVGWFIMYVWSWFGLLLGIGIIYASKE